MRLGLIAAFAIAHLAAPGLSEAQSQAGRRYAPIGLFIGAIEEGARIFTPARLLPREHPEALGHDFPTVQQLHATEYPLLLWLGERVGLRLGPTLQRYPAEPDSLWPYQGLEAPPDTAALRDAPVRRRPRREAPIPGLRASVYDGAELVAFIVDTRGLSLEERGMTRPTSMGLDVTRREFLERVETASSALDRGFSVVLWDGKE